MIEGIFGFYKPVGPSSGKFLGQIKRLLKETMLRQGHEGQTLKSLRIGHAGTLDPLASGVLVIAIGRENTRKISEVVEAEKEYITKIKLGYESTTDDEEGVKKLITNDIRPKTEDIGNTLQKFVGKIMQTPPIYSALKIKGKPMYKLARKGETAETIKINPREVEIKAIDLLKYEYPYLEVRVVTGKGVYIRALARDIGRELKTGAYMAELERTRVGQFTKERALSIDEFQRDIQEKQS